jgi:muramoyltetrapeptide carboxypeptidase
VGLVAPASANFRSADIEIAQEVARAFSLEPRLGAHVRDRHGYLAGRDEDRAADVNAFFADSAVSAVFAIRGGWGCVVFEGEALTMANPPGNEQRLVQRDNRVRTIAPGRARGRLLGGNLTVLTALLGSPYVPALDGAILFLEDVNEEIYRVDRMLTQLRLAGLLGRVRGFVFGSCSQCEPGEGYGSLTLEEVLDEHVKPLGIPAYEGAMIGHQDQPFTVPVGVLVELDAAAGTIQMLEPAVL